MVERAVDGHVWQRLADPGWDDPLDPSFAPTTGARWTPQGGPDTLHLNADVATARDNLVRFLAGSQVAPEDLADDSYCLVAATLPTNQRVADAHSGEGLIGLGLPVSYPLDARGAVVSHATCQPIGQRCFDRGLDGIHCRSAATADGSGRELAWFSRGRRAVKGEERPFSAWYYG